jgi:hypothetical protein
MVCPFRSKFPGADGSIGADRPSAGSRGPAVRACRQADRLLAVTLGEVRMWKLVATIDAADSLRTDRMTLVAARTLAVLLER